MPTKKVDPTYVEFARTIGEDPTDPMIVWLIEEGFESGFPPCCIAYYVKVWSRICWTLDFDEKDSLEFDYRALPLLEAHGQYVDWLRQQCPPKGPHYIPCPACLLKKSFVEVKKTKRRRKRPKLG